MRDSPAANPAPSAARPRVRAGAIQRASAMPGFARRAIPAPDQRRESSWFRARPARQFGSLIKRDRAGGETVHCTPDIFGIVVSISQSRFEESKQGSIRPDEKTRLFRLEIHANQAPADSKFGAVPQHGRAHSFFVKESAVGRIQIL